MVELFAVSTDLHYQGAVITDVHAEDSCEQCAGTHAEGGYGYLEDGGR